MVNILLTPGTGTIQVSVAEASHAEDRVDVKQISNFAWQHLKAASFGISEKVCHLNRHSFPSMTTTR
jgi:hypothetical protein